MRRSGCLRCWSRCGRSGAMSKLIDLTGQRFGRLTVIERGANTPSGQTTWICSCDCGKTVTVSGGNLRSGNSTSCGCTRNGNCVDKHLYYTWRDMRQRCCFPHHPSYCNYGARGITVCAEWSRSYEAFQDWALAHGWNPEDHNTLTIDRIDNNGPYSPENCRFTDRWTQANNRRCTKYLTFKGRTLSISAWSRETGICQSTLYRRLSMGWSVEQALTEPVHKKQK